MVVSIDRSPHIRFNYISLLSVIWLAFVLSFTNSKPELFSLKCSKQQSIDCYYCLATIFRMNSSDKENDCYIAHLSYSKRKYCPSFQYICMQGLYNITKHSQIHMNVSCFASDISAQPLITTG